MSDEKETIRLPSFQETVLNELKSMGLRLDRLETSLSQMQTDIKPIHGDFVQLNRSLKEGSGNIERKLDVMNKEAFQLKADHLGIEARLDKVESEVQPQIVVQDQQF